jgi:hypothetical protein
MSQSANPELNNNDYLSMAIYFDPRLANKIDPPHII